ncbi:MAG TPA: septal ring lytic transglycosylase RlpA family protein [Bacteroidales bacterium]|nr:septal ring lytic transglycosylase RlpA family protein [Bacteroidales bacterium]
MIDKNLVFFLLFLPFFSFGQVTEQTGYCSYYSDKFNGQKTASGEIYNKNLFTAAHRALPFNTVVQVTNLRNDKKVLVKINDRGPHSKGRILDISKAAAVELEMIRSGVEKVKVEVVDVPPSYLKQDTLSAAVTDSVVNVPDTYKESTKQGQVSVKEKNTGEKIKTDTDRPIFDAENQPANPGGYGVQIGYYRILANCKRQLVDFQKKYKVKGYVFTERKTKNTYYRLIMGAYTDKKQAQRLQTQLSTEIPGCFLVNWEKL